MAKGPGGTPPSAPPLNRCSTANFQPPPEGESSNTVPQPSGAHPLPPDSVVPYRLPLASRYKGATGKSPSLPSKRCSIVNFHLPSPTGESSNTVPQPTSHPLPPPLAAVP